MLNRPFVVTVIGGVFVLGISTYVQNRSWELQQRFLISQSTLTGKIAAAQSTAEDVVKHVGLVLTAEALIIGAHEGRFDKRQLEESIDRNARLRDEWDLAEEVLKMRVRTQFPVAEVQNPWEEMLATFDPLYECVEQLQTFATTATSDAHRKRIAECRTTVERIEGHLSIVAAAMARHIDNVGRERR